MERRHKTEAGITHAREARLQRFEALPQRCAGRLKAVEPVTQHCTRRAPGWESLRSGFPRCGFACSGDGELIAWFPLAWREPNDHPPREHVRSGGALGVMLESSGPPRGPSTRRARGGGKIVRLCTKRRGSSSYRFSHSLICNALQEELASSTLRRTVVLTSRLTVAYTGKRCTPSLCWGAKVLAMQVREGRSLPDGGALRIGD